MSGVSLSPEQMVAKNGVLNLKFVSFVMVLDAYKPIESTMKNHLQEMAIIFIREEFRDKFLAK